MDIKKIAQDMQDSIVKWRRDLHQIPEIGNDLTLTTKYVQDRLKEMDIPFVTMVKGSGILATITGSKPGKTVALRADMDALPIAEEAPIDFKSTNGNMHSCGHDAHTAILLGAAKVLADNKAGIAGTVKLIFQPNEEGLGGAKPMIEEGCLEGVGAIFGLHIGCLFPDVKESGKIIISHGSAMACRDTFKIKLIGRGAHAAWPENGVDPISIAAQVINGIYMIKARECSALSPSVISICRINGGSANNIIPESVELEGSTRSVDKKTREMIARRINQVVKDTCRAHNAAYELDFVWESDITKNDPKMADAVIKAAKDLDFSSDVIPQPNPIMGSEDMSCYLNEVPGAFFFLSSVVDQGGIIYGHHNPKFMLNENVFHKGTAMFLQLVINYLREDLL